MHSIREYMEKYIWSTACMTRCSYSLLYRLRKVSYLLTGAVRWHAWEGPGAGQQQPAQGSAVTWMEGTRCWAAACTGQCGDMHGKDQVLGSSLHGAVRWHAWEGPGAGQQPARGSEVTCMGETRCWAAAAWTVHIKMHICTMSHNNISEYTVVSGMAWT